MEGDGLSELLSVTSNVMKSLATADENKNRPNQNVDVSTVLKNAIKSKSVVISLDRNHAGSPFESPRSLTSQPDSGICKTETKSEPSFPRGIDSKINKTSNSNAKRNPTSHKNSNGDNEIIKTNVASNQQKQDIDIDLKQSKQIFVQHFLNGDADSKQTTKGHGHIVNHIYADESSDELQIIDIQAKSVETLGSMSSGMEEDRLSDAVDQVAEANLSLSGQFFPVRASGKTSNSQCQSLRQGALSKGVFDPTKQTVFDDVYISNFHSSKQQKGIRETLAKRSESNRPKKQHIQPQIIQSSIRSGDESDKDSIRHHADSISGSKSVTATMHQPKPDPSLTAAVAASAAVAVTQPFIKAQQDLEARMQQLLAQLAKSQEKSSERGIPENLNSTTVEKEEKTHSNKRISELEHRVAEMNERRLEHMESLQHQQMQMQAQLLMMSRSRSPKSHITVPMRQASPQRARQSSRIPQALIKPSKGNLSHGSRQLRSSKHDMTASQQLQSSYFNPETLSKHHNYLSEVRELQGSLLDTPAPRKNVPEPTPYYLLEEPQANLGFLQELLNQKETPVKDTTFNVKGNRTPELNYNRNNNARGKRLDKSPVDQARRLINSLSTLEQETSDSIWGPRETFNKEMEHVHAGPAPLEFYLKYPKAEGSPYPNFGDRKPEVEKKERRRSHSSHYLEARQVLKQLEMTKDTLEKNLDQVVRSHRDMHVFSALLSGASEGGTSDQMRIEKMVSKKIASLNQDIQREVLRGLAEEEAKKLTAEVEHAQLKATGKKTGVKPDYTKSNTFKQMVEEARISQRRAAQSVPQSFNKGKENKIIAKKQPAKPSIIKDEKTMTRTYGKAEYQRGRTTMREPYMHFQNTKKGRSVAPNDSIIGRDGRSRSPKSKKSVQPTEQPVPRQYFFSPTRGYIPMEANMSGAIEGHIVPMAIPLRAPRMESGVRTSATPIASKSANPITSTPVTAMNHNVAVVSFPVDSDRRARREKEAELSKQVLPPIDIDSISPSSSRRSDIQIGSPQQAHPNVTFLYDTFDEDNLNKNMNMNSMMEEDESEDDQTGEGIRLPGYEPQVPNYTGPAFPPQSSTAKPDWMAGGERISAPTMVSDVIAEDLRRKDVLENNAIIWLEQELMARILTEVMPFKTSNEQADISAAHSVKSEDSDREESLLVTDMIGHGGLQLFIDAGQPVDNALVNALVKEVIQEKVNSMLAQRVDENESQGTLTKVKVTDEVEEALQFREQAGPPQIPTPEMTPKTSPVASPRRQKPHIQQPVTPPLSPPSNAYIFKPPKDLTEEEEVPIRQQQHYAREPQPQLVMIEKPQVLEVESESEISVSIDISEELQRIAGKVMEPVSQLEEHHDVATPPASPLPVVQEVKPTVAPIQLTPPTSPPPLRPAASVEIPTTKPKPAEVAEVIERRMAEEEEEDSEEEEEEESIEQPKPIMMSVAVGEDRSMTSEREHQAKSRSPSPQRNRAQMVHSPTSESQFLSEDSTISDSVNDNISEGQWLLSRSEGQIVGLPGKVFSHDLRKGYQQMVDLSTASTLGDTDDIELDEPNLAKSEGEILISGLPAPEQDPMLELLVQMQKNPMLAIQKNLSRAQVSQAFQHADPGRSVTGRSLGEMSVGQVAPSRVVQVQPRRGEERQRKGRASPSFSPTNSLDRSVTEDNYSYEEERRRGQRDGNNGKQQRGRTSPQRQQNHGRAQQREQQQLRTRSPDLILRSNNGSPQSSAKNRMRAQMQYQPVLSDSAPSITRTRSPTKYGDQRRHGGESNRLSRSSEQGYRKSGSSNFRQSGNSASDFYSNDQVSRSAESLSMRRSGEGALTSSLKSTKQSNVKKSVEFDLTGTFGRARSSVSRSRDSNSNLTGASRLSDPGASLGLTYSYDENSVDESELRRIMDENGSSYGPYRMSVTLPSTGYENDSDFSEIDASQNE